MPGLLAAVVCSFLLIAIPHTDVVQGGPMDFYFLLFSLFFPRIVLLVSIFLIPENFPANSVRQIADILLGIFVPRILILIYIYQNMGYDNIWFAAHLIVAILAYIGGGRETHRRRFRRVD